MKRIRLLRVMIALVTIPKEAGEAEVAGVTKVVDIKAADVGTKDVGEGAVVGEAEAAASRGLNQSLLDGIRDTSSHACLTNNGTKCAPYVMGAKLALSTPATAPDIMVAAIKDMAMGITTHHHKALLRPSTSNHTHHLHSLCSNKYHLHHRHLLHITSELFTSTPIPATSHQLGTWTIQVSIVLLMVPRASDMNCRTTYERWWVAYNMTYQASRHGPN
jgi:hypothetical protein